VQQVRVVLRALALLQLAQGVSAPRIAGMVPLTAQAIRKIGHRYQQDDGTILFVRNMPPPAQRPIFGTSGVIDALAGPPMPQVVRFENFPAESVDGIARSTTLASASPRGATVERTLDNLAAAFKPPSAGETGTSILIEGRGKTPEVLKLFGEEGALASPRHTVAWTSGRVEAATPAGWAQAFGAEVRLDTARADAIIVRFGAGPQRPASTLGIQVEVPPAKRLGISVRLPAIIRSWLMTQPIMPSPWAAGLVDLRAVLKKQLQPADLQFFYERNAKKIRAAELREIHIGPIKPNGA
jgi:hypothetical protein